MANQLSPSPYHIYLGIDSPDEPNRILANIQGAGIRDNSSETGVKRLAAPVLYATNYVNLAACDPEVLLTFYMT